MILQVEVLENGVMKVSDPALHGKKSPYPYRSSPITFKKPIGKAFWRSPKK